MTKRQQDRIKRLLPNGKPRWLRIYDNNGETIDRYSVLFTGRYTHKTNGQHYLLGMSGSPTHPQGVGSHESYPYQCDTIGPNGRPDGRWPPAIGRSCHLGKRINFDDLPAECQRVVLHDYCQLWDIEVAA